MGGGRVRITLFSIFLKYYILRALNMMNAQTESALVRLFLTIIDVEKEVDLAREALLSHPRYDTLAI